MRIDATTEDDEACWKYILRRVQARGRFKKLGKI